MKHIKQQWLYIYALVAVTLPVLVSGACNPGDGKLCNPLKNEMGLWELVEYIVRDILVEIIAPIVITLALLWSGFMFIAAQGNNDKLIEARRNFLYVVAGSILLIGAYLILEVILNTVEDITN